MTTYSATVVNNSMSSSSQDLNVQMLKMITGAFSILSTVLADNRAVKGKLDWQKFSGDEPTSALP